MLHLYNNQCIHLSISISVLVESIPMDGSHDVESEPEKERPHTHKEPEEQTRTHACNLCSKSYACHSSLVRHLKKEHDVYRCDIPKTSTESSESIKNMCNTCGKTFKIRSCLLRHMKKHSIMLPCSTCHLYFESAEKLDEHNDKTHSEKPLCPHCGKRFLRRSSLNVHLKSHDTNPVNYFICPIENCSRKFILKSQYSDHINTHTGIKPYICERCNAKYTLKQSLDAHTRKCVKEIQYKCTECDKQFTSSGGLSHHLRGKHRNELFRCECGKVYKYLTGLRLHKRNTKHGIQ